MEFTEWEPVYEAILTDFGFDRAADERARDRLAALVDAFDLDRLQFADETVAIAGGASSFRAELSLAREADRVVAVSSAADVCRDERIDIDLMVTDLDKNPETAVTLTREGTPVAVAAHGDNLAALETYVPRMHSGNVLPTTQATPHGPVVNLGGFTDGDRAAFVADNCGAAALVFPGWDFDDPSVSSVKRRKLAWAERLLHWLERRRGEQFGLLDGRREALDVSAFLG